jgi:protein-S-isoprenylcysteine O-methyltransferase Ste14
MRQASLRPQYGVGPGAFNRVEFVRAKKMPQTDRLTGRLASGRSSRRGQHPMLAIRRSTINLRHVQQVRKLVLLSAILAAVALMAVGDSRWASGTTMHETIEWVGLVLIVVCILGRTWSSIYIGGRKIRSLVTLGPYSVTRNPLYAFSILGAAGAGAQLGSIVLALVSGFIAWLVFHLVVTKEERVLVTRFGNKYRQYLAKVPRFLPNAALWRDADKLEVHPSIVRWTFIDACVFLLAIPLAEGFEYLHDAGILATLVHFP